MMKSCRTFLLASLIWGLSTGLSNAEWISGEASFAFGPETSELIACTQATTRAKENALSKKFGEQIVSQDLMTCSEATDNGDACALHQSIWRNVGGLILKTRNISQKVTDQQRLKTCQVSLEILPLDKSKAKAAFDLDVALNRNLFRDGEELFITVKTSLPLYVTIFQWAPSENITDPAIKLFPNTYETNNKITRTRTIPPDDSASPYRFRLKAANIDAAATQEFLLVVATRNPIDFLNSYSLEELQQRITEIPFDQRLVVHRSYGILGK